MRSNSIIRQCAMLAMVVVLAYLSITVASFTTPASAEPADENIAETYETTLHQYGSAYELNADTAGDLWVSDNIVGEIRRYTADFLSLRVYSGMGAVSDARPGADGMVWYVDQDTLQLGRLDPQSETVVFWPLPPEAVSGFGTALDEQGQVWVSDFNQTSLYRFDLATSSMCSFDASALMGGGSPSLAIEEGALWLSDFYFNAILRLDLQTNQMTRWKYTSVYWDFEAEGLSGDGAGGLWFTDSNRNSLARLDLTQAEAPQLLRYQLPAGSVDPLMLARQEGVVWFSDLTPDLGVLNPTLAFSTSFTPEVEQVTLEPVCEQVSGSEPLSVTVAHSTPVWTPVTYTLGTPANGWMTIPLLSDSYPTGIALHEGMLFAVDGGRQILMGVNMGVSVTACGLADQDGLLETTTDQSPLPGESVYLRVDGVRQEMAEITGEDGCFTWLALPPAQSFGLEFVPPEEWQFLTSDKVDFKVAQPGDTFQYNFILTNPAILTFLPLVTR
jgi:streptogramin lyase